MPSSAAVHDQLTRIIVQVVGCEPSAVVQSARLGKDLGVDSLSIVEVVEKLGQNFDIYIPDETVDSMRTVQDAINAVVHHDPKAKGPAHPATNVVAERFAPTARQHQLPPEEVQRRKHIAMRFAWAFAGIGVVLGLVFGLGGAALVSASGLKGAGGPATSAPSTPAPTKAKSSATATPTPTNTATTSPAPTLSADNTSIAPGEKLRLTGAFPGLSAGTAIQVQVKDSGQPWDNFPVTTTTKSGGTFETVIFTTRTGERQFRLIDKASNTTTPSVTVTIGR